VNARVSQPRLSVILHADIVDSTALVRRDERLAHERIQLAFAALARAIEAYGGSVNEIRGDAVVAEFSRASDAVLAALAGQQASAAAQAGITDDVSPVLRVGIALGEVVVADATVTGAGVVLAQRLEQLAPAAAVCISGAIREALPDRLPLTYQPLGEHPVKGFEEPVRALLVTLRDGHVLPAATAAATRAARRSLRRRRAAIVGLATAGLLVAALAVAWVMFSDRGPLPGEPGMSTTTPTVKAAGPTEGAPGRPSPKERSIVVLPFTNMSADPSQDYFSDGLTEDIITDLARISGLLVIARNSSFVYKGRAVDVKAVGRELGVRYVLEGSVRRAGERVRITAQLIDVDSGMHLWADRYDRELTDIFALQDEVTRTIIDALAINLTEEEAEQLRKPTGVGSDAYDLLLRGNEVMARFSPEAMAEARAIYEQVVRLAPRYARAHANIAFAYAQEALFGWVDDTARSVRKGLEAAEQARRIDPNIPQLQLAIANLYGAELHWEAAEEAVRRAIALEPSYADGFVMLAVTLTFLGDLDAAAEAIAHAKRFNPHYSFIYLWVEARIAYLQERYQEAAVNLEDAVARNPEFDQTRIMLAATYGQLGRLEDAQWEAAEVLARNPQFTIASDLRVRGFRDAVLLARYVEGLRKAGLPE
jgi:TolB-like protein/class 3 adenylate cyclase/Tfp pilus assembly protein PilF